MPYSMKLIWCSLENNWKISYLCLALFDMPNLNRFDILSISIFCKIALSISISIFSKITISILISIFLKLPYQYRYFSELPYQYRYRYFSKVSIYRQLIFHIDILTRRRSNKIVFYRCTRGRSNKMCFTGAKKCLFIAFSWNVILYSSLQYP